MMRVENKKAIWNLSKKGLQSNRIRNRIAVLAIVLSAILFTALFTMGSGTVESLKQASLRQAGGDGHAVVKYITEKDFENIKKHPLIKKISYNRILCDEIVNKVFIKRKTEFWYFDKNAREMTFKKLSGGKWPVAENEVVADTKTLEIMGIPKEIGQQLSLEMNIRGKYVKRDFILSGWWESDPVFPVGQVLSSEKYMELYKSELESTYKTDQSIAGSICTYIMFGNSINMERKIERVLEESGYSLDPKSERYLNYNVSWAYIASNFKMDVGTITALGAGVLLIVLTGYLIIYNIFQISVMKDIRYYGLLKTIGTTGKQIKTIIRRQALTLCAAGIPVGLLAGFLIGKYFVPFIMKSISYAESGASVSGNLWIFAGSGFFTLFTVGISTFRPGKIAAGVSPVEAVRFSEGDSRKKGIAKRKTREGSIWYMALRNLEQNPIKTLLVVLSLSLSLILLNSVYTISDSISMDKFLEKYNDTDFLIAHADYFQNKYWGKESELSDKFIKAVESQPGFENGGRIYSGMDEVISVEDKENLVQKENAVGEFDFFTSLYGLEELPLKRLCCIDGSLDLEKLKSGEYIMEGVKLDDNENPIMESAHFKIGDTVVLHKNIVDEDGKTIRRMTRKYKVLGHVAVKYYSNSDRKGSSYSFYMPAKAYKDFVENVSVMSYAFNMDTARESTMEEYLAEYTDKEEPYMNYTSKMESQKEFSGMRDIVLKIGGALCLIIGMIGVLNYFNAVLTGMIAREREFAVMQSIGMTKKQLKKMLCLEGVSYFGMVGLVSIVLSIIFSILAVRKLCNLLWFCSYHFTIWTVFAVLPFLFALGIGIPLLSHRLSAPRSMVEKLRETE